MNQSMEMGEFDAFAALLDWYGEVGVDHVLGDEPVDRFVESAQELAERRARAPAAPSRIDTDARQGEARQARTGEARPREVRTGAGNEVRLPPERARPEPTAQPVARPSTGATVPGGGEIMAARTAAADAISLEALQAMLKRFDGCNLRKTAKTLVFADGNPAARVMLIGEAPGREEDEAGLPFVGKSGQLLDRMLAAIGLDRTSVYIANVVPWRPPGNRTPTPQETEICKPFIARQIALARPDLLVFLGGAAAAALAGTTEGILKLRGRWLDYDTGDGTIPALATLHPAYLLRQPLQKRLAWRDFRDLKRRIEALPAR